MLERDQAHGLLAELRSLQRKRRVAEVDWVDALYRAYMLLVFALVAVIVLSTIIGDGRVAADTRHDVTRNGVGILSIVVAVVLAGALRSGSRGGPHALQPADVHHLLLAPLDRDLVLRAPAYRQLRVVGLSGLAVGAIAGNLAFRRLPGGAGEWVACGAAFGLCTALAMWGTAALASGRRIGRVVANGLGLLLIAWAAFDLALHLTTAPTSWIAAVAMLPLSGRVVAVLGPVVAIGAVVVALRAIGGIAIEAALRRAGLVGQLRFAATVQDLRVVILLHRQLASERSRPRPWVRHRTKGEWLPVWRRDWNGVMRWPVSRVARVVILSAVAIAASIGAWLGTTPLIVVAGVATFVVALDISEGLAQEVDHPTLVDATPVSTGWLYLRHLAAPAAVLATFAVLPVAGLAVLGRSSVTVDVAVATAVTAVVGSIAGAALSIVLGPPPLGSPWLMTFPEMMGTLLIARQAVAPGLAIAGFLPLALAVHASRNHTAVVNAATAVIGPVVVIAGVAIGYVGSRGARRY
jgi:hypothetical protein